MKLRTSRRGVVLAVLMLAVAMIASACFPIHTDPTPNVNWRTHLPRKQGQVAKYDLMQLWTIAGCTFSADAQAAAPASAGLTRAHVRTQTDGSASGCYDRHKLHTVVRARAHVSDIGWHYIECSTISWACRVDWNGPSFYLAVNGGTVCVPLLPKCISTGPMLVRSSNGHYAEVRFDGYPGSAGHVNYRWTTHILDTNNARYIKHMSAHCGPQHYSCEQSVAG